jgi:hypothetical protein
MKIRVNDFVRNGIIVSLEPDRHVTVPANRGAGSQAATAQCVGVVLPGAQIGAVDVSNYLINTP